MSLFASLLGITFLLSELWLARLRRSSREPGSQAADRGTLSLLWRVIMIAVTVGITLSSFDVGPRLPAGVPWGIVGAAVFCLGMALRWWAIRHLGRFFTVDVAVADHHQVVDDGPYRLVRHPSYTGSLLQFSGLALSLGHWVGVVVILVPVAVVILTRIRLEESVLQTALGEPYLAYMGRTRRLVPYVY